MKKNLAILLSFVVVLILPVSALAVGLPNQPGGGNSLDSIFNSIQTLAWQVFAIIAFVMFIIAGVLFLTSGGDPDKVTTARQAFMWGIAGIVVGILAFSIMSIIQAVIH